MNVEQEGPAVCKIYSHDDIKRKKGKKIYVSGDLDHLECPFASFKAKNDDYLQICPRGKERDVIYISGSSGAGKSHFAALFTLEYMAENPKNPVYLFSSINRDKCLDALASKGLKRVLLGEDFVNTDFVLSDFEDSLLIFDDIDVIVDRGLKAKLYQILNNLLMTGRHSKTSIIFTSHIATNGKDTKVLLAECTHLVCFPKMMNGRSRDYLLKSYIGLNTKEIAEILKLRSRAVVFIRGYPQVVVYEKGCYIINGEYL